MPLHLGTWAPGHPTLLTPSEMGNFMFARPPRLAIDWSN
jgi:hypothetical protein